MPTTEPLDDGDDVGGPLKPIAEFSEPAPQAAPAAAPAMAPQAPATSPTVTVQADATQPKPSAAAATAPAGVARPVVQGPVLGRPQNGRTVRTNLDKKVLSLSAIGNNRAADRTAAPQHNDTAAMPMPTAADKPFSDNELRDAWETYIVTHSHEQLLTNTMRAHLPTRADSTSAELHMEVESQIQADIVAESLAALLKYLRQTLSNGTITLQTDILQGLNSPSTWNEREVLADILRRHPAMLAYIDSLGLTLG